MARPPSQRQANRQAPRHRIRSRHQLLAMTSAKEPSRSPRVLPPLPRTPLESHEDRQVHDQARGSLQRVRRRLRPRHRLRRWLRGPCGSASPTLQRVASLQAVDRVQAPPHEPLHTVAPPPHRAARRLRPIALVRRATHPRVCLRDTRPRGRPHRTRSAKANVQHRHGE